MIGATPPGKMMLRAALLATAFIAAGTAVAQDIGDAARDIGDAGVDFILRPTQDETEDFWAYQIGAEEPLAEDGFGVPLAGPTGEEPIGPAMAGPDQASPGARARGRRIEVEDPFAATGVRLGTFVIRPAIEIGVNATDNAAGGSDEESAAGLIVAPELNIRSEGSRHEVEVDLRGETILYGEKEFDERSAEARISARYDLTSRTSIEAEAGYRYDLDTFTDPDTPAGALERPPVHEFDATLGATQRFGRIAVKASGFAARNLHDDVGLAGGGTALREELDNTNYGIRLRTSYAVSPALAPFVEVAAGRREFDLKLDDSGFARSSDWTELRGGLFFDFGPKLAGEVALGYRREELEDDRLEDLDALIAAASILWSPRRLTEVRFDLLTGTGPTSIPDASGSVIYAGRLSVARRVTSRLRLEAGAGLDHERFVGFDREDVTYTGFAGFSYAFNRRASLEARYVYEQIDSSEPGADSQENSVGVRIRLQR